MPHRNNRKLTLYQQKLLDPRWQRVRLLILERDKWTCTYCEDNKSTLHVHHDYYIHDKDPWDYPDDVLRTLCEDCHTSESLLKRSNIEKELCSFLRASGISAKQLAGLLKTMAEMAERIHLKWYIHFISVFPYVRGFAKGWEEYLEFTTSINNLPDEEEENEQVQP